MKPLPAPDPAVLPDFRAVTLDTPDGEHLKGWWRPPAAAQGVVLYLHGNAGTIADPWRTERLKALSDAGFGVLGIEDRGVGGSSGHPSEPGLITDAETAYDYAAKQAPGAKIALFGDSLGTGVSVALATRRPVAGLVLDSPYASILRLAQADYSWLPTAAILRSHWNSEDRIRTVSAPVFIAHCDADKRIPLAEGQRLFKAANPPKEMVVVAGCGHVQTWSDAVKSKVLTDFAAWIGAH